MQQQPLPARMPPKSLQQRSRYHSALRTMKVIPNAIQNIEGRPIADQVSDIVDEGRAAIQCLDAEIKEMEQSLNDAKDSVLSMRSLVTTVVIAIPLVIAVSHPALMP